MISGDPVTTFFWSQFWMTQMFNLWLACPEYCERYAKAEDIGSRPDEDSSDGDVSEEEYMSSDEEMAGHADPWTSSLVWIGS